MSKSEYSPAIRQLAINPSYISYPLSWLGHIPFAAWLVETLNPAIFVELGSYSGTSYFSFCQAVRDGGLSTQCFAVDTWVGDDHTGGYGEDVFQSFCVYNDTQFESFSRYLRMTFEAARGEFQDKSVDLLHIDGLHTYDAVKEDFETWLPKMSDKGVIIFHDTAVEATDFGVKKFWSEVSDQYPSFNFLHSNGLGVLLVGDHLEASLLADIEGVAPVVDRLAERLWLQQIVREKEHKITEYEKAFKESERIHLALDEAHVALVNEHTSLAARYSDLDSAGKLLKSEVDRLNLTVIPEMQEVLASAQFDQNELYKIKKTMFWKVYNKVFSKFKF